MTDEQDARAALAAAMSAELSRQAGAAPYAPEHLRRTVYRDATKRDGDPPAGWPESRGT